MARLEHQTTTTTMVATYKHVTEVERAEMSRRMRHAGMSVSAIAAAKNRSKSSVSRALSITSETVRDETRGRPRVFDDCSLHELLCSASAHGATAAQLKKDNELTCSLRRVQRVLQHIKTRGSLAGGSTTGDTSSSSDTGTSPRPRSPAHKRTRTHAHSPRSKAKDVSHLRRKDLYNETQLEAQRVQLALAADRAHTTC